MRSKLFRLNSGLFFKEDTHSYFYDTVPLTSVTTLIKAYSPYFDSEAVQRDISDRLGAFAGTLEANRWEEEGEAARLIGNEVHKFVEESVSHRSPAIDIDDKLYKYKLAAIRYLTESRLFSPRYIGLIPEQRIFHPEYLLAGTLDLIAEKPNGHVDLYDWKTNKRFRVVGEGDFMSTPLDKRRYSDLLIYSLQLNLYKIILEEAYKIPVDDMRIVRLPSSGYPVEYLVKDMPESHVLVNHWMEMIS